MKRKLLRNWNKVGEIECTATRIAVATCHHEEILRRLIAAFPDCFREGAEGETDQIAFSVILEDARARLANDFQGQGTDQNLLREVANYSWAETAHELGISIIAQWNTEDAATMPSELRSQLNRELPSGPLFVTYQGADCVVALLEDDRQGFVYPGETIDADDKIGFFLLAPKNAINFNY